MNSLRLRLILALSLITVIPLAIAMVLLTARIQSMVRDQASERLGSALGGIQSQLESDGRRIAGKLEILGKDPQLKRLYLLRPAASRDLTEYLTERQFLLGLDFLSVADTVEAVEGLGGLAMAARAPIRYQNATVGFVQGGLLFDAPFLQRLGKTSGLDLILRDNSGRVVAATRPETSVGYLTRTIPLEVGSPPYGTLMGLASTAAADRTIASLQLASLLLGLLGLGIAIPLAILWSSQISRPVERLAAFSDKLARGEWEEPIALHSVRELQTLVLALDRMRRDLQTYRDKLVTSERQAAWSQMARKVAHEVKNPLTPIAISIADLKRSYELKRPDFPEILDQAVRTVGEEVETLRRLLQEFSDFARIPPPELKPCRLSLILSDLEALYGHEISAGHLTFAQPAHEVTFSADQGQIRQALINLIKNGLEALNGDGRVTVSARSSGEALEVSVSDSGPGLSEEQRNHLFEPGFTTKAQGSGLGLTIVERIVNDHEGTVAVEPNPDRGTTFRIRLPLGPAGTR